MNPMKTFCGYFTPVWSSKLCTVRFLDLEEWKNVHSYWIAKIKELMNWMQFCFIMVVKIQKFCRRFMWDHRPLTNTFWLFFPDILALAASIQELTKASRHSRTAMWCALMTTIHFSINPELAVAEVLPSEESEAQLGPAPEQGTATEDKLSSEQPNPTSNVAATAMQRGMSQ